VRDLQKRPFPGEKPEKKPLAKGGPRIGKIGGAPFRAAFLERNAAAGACFRRFSRRFAREGQAFLEISTAA